MTLVIAVLTLAILSGLRTLMAYRDRILDERLLIEDVDVPTQWAIRRSSDARHRSARGPPSSRPPLAAHDPLHVHPPTT